ncbi:class I SAM-dependent methyltransferase [Microseira wollei]|uniref:O-methyltransferase-like protein n=1 Tax=Microseira wollei NIES-4236 TaxID=2530354 RepID=A0AAV3XAA4_9CYAN|nr:class I SAM-dependent methyltransferase [Microseira wollei]GET37222.1 hypothetical protein MiSe_19750 [Microseira wollei NIES-4236]
MNQLLEHIYNTGYVEDGDGKLINPFPTATPRETGTILYEIVQQYNLERTMEIGMAYGLSTLFICQAHQDRGVGNHTAIDPKQSTIWKSIGLLNIKRSGLSERLRFFETFSDEVLPQIVKTGENFDFAFIDGSHLFDYALLDFFYIDKLLAVGGYVVFDDLWMPAVRKVISFVLRNRSYELVKIKPKANWIKRLARVTYRLVQNPLDLYSLKIKFITENICLLKKVSEDSRVWDFHRSF